MCRPQRCWQLIRQRWPINFRQVRDFELACIGYDSAGEQWCVSKQHSAVINPEPPFARTVINFQQRSQWYECLAERTPKSSGEFRQGGLGIYENLNHRRSSQATKFHTPSPLLALPGLESIHNCLPFTIVGRELASIFGYIFANSPNIPPTTVLWEPTQLGPWPFNHIFGLPTRTDCCLEGLEEAFELVAQIVALRIGPEELDDI